MDPIYYFIIGLILVLSCFDLVVGVSNDAANFLNSAVGSKAAPRRTIVLVAALGIIIGSLFSSGMMEIARSGVFMPARFSFHDIMLIFLAVMLTDVILLDVFNTFGLPTSTTVSIVFELLGGAVAAALFKIWSGEPGVAQELSSYINSSKALAIISGIFSSVFIAFICGITVMWISRLIFSFNYQKSFKYLGAVWCGVALTAITYFAIFKGLKGSTLVTKDMIRHLDDHIWLYVCCSLAFWTVLMAVLQNLCKVNILKVSVLAGTMALALSFAGNDLVNFIGVFMAGQSSMEIAAAAAAQGADLTTLSMGGLMAPVTADWRYLLGAGVIMVLALMFSKTALPVTDTEVNLARQGGGVERFGFVPPARAIVRSAIALGRGVKRLIPARMLVRMNHQWDPAPQPLNPKDRVAFDLIRATVNLTVASLLIAWATGRQLPLSTTYVTFMVAMGSSLADKAWGRESAVYRVTGVLTVISGWFMTGLAAFTLAAVMATILHYGQVYAIFGLLALVVVILVKSTIMHRKRESKLSVERFDQITEENILDVCSHQIVDSTLKLREIYNDTVENFFQGDRKALKELADAAERLAMTSSEHHKYDILPILYKMQSRSLDMGYHFVQALEHLNEATQSLSQFSESIFTYVDNNHTPFTIDQVDDLKEVHTALIKLLDEYC